MAQCTFIQILRDDRRPICLIFENIYRANPGTLTAIFYSDAFITINQNVNKFIHTSPLNYIPVNYIPAILDARRKILLDRSTTG
jgi:hypothetical protein